MLSLFFPSWVIHLKYQKKKMIILFHYSLAKLLEVFRTSMKCMRHRLCTQRRIWDTVSLSDVAKIIKNPLIRLHLETIQVVQLFLWGLLLKNRWNYIHKHRKLSVSLPNMKIPPCPTCHFWASGLLLLKEVLSVLTVFFRIKPLDGACSNKQ